MCCPEGSDMLALTAKVSYFKNNIKIKDQLLCILFLGHKRISFEHVTKQACCFSSSLTLLDAIEGEQLMVDVCGIYFFILV